ncbi:MAG: 30S ribosomal protein S9 [Desulfobacterales bacterium CG23_combo_of_CG06-09_8_20_14_all_51_8]|nr:MAG: 30S ribosomal protein S9 [Desulfobacterales bacterium CG23_combo_of_CG06-09_8_20_14_all_51_8]
MGQENTYYATGRRKTAVARTWLKPGKGEIIINNKPMDEYFRVMTAKQITSQPLELTNTVGQFDIWVNVKGGGTVGQAGAVRHGITQALFQVNPDFRSMLKRAGFIRRDPRKKERQKYGQKGARARYQFSKR